MVGRRGCGTTIRLLKQISDEQPDAGEPPAAVETAVSGEDFASFEPPQAA
jgi:hypothetical protein